MKVINEYATHHYIAEYNFNNEIYCPKCGSKGVWISQEGDYYEGQDHICLNCCHLFTMPTLSEMNDDNEIKIIKQLSSGKIDKATTPRGN